MRPIFFVAATCLALASAAAHAATTGAVETTLTKILNDACIATTNRNVVGMTAPFLKSADSPLMIFDFSTPRERNFADLEKADTAFVSSAEGPITCVYNEIHSAILANDAAYSWSILTVGGKLTGGPIFSFTVRSTDIWRKIGGKWLIVHEHNSFPIDMSTGKADLQSRP